MTYHPWSADYELLPASSRHLMLCLPEESTCVDCLHHLTEPRAIRRQLTLDSTPTGSYLEHGSPLYRVITNLPHVITIVYKIF